MEKLSDYTTFLARLLLSALFIVGAYEKVQDVGGFTGYLVAGGLPSFLTWPAILFEAAVGISMILGFQARIMALLAAVFCLVTAALYHTDATQMVMLLKNLGLAGGFLMVFAHGPGRIAMDRA